MSSINIDNEIRFRVVETTNLINDSNVFPVDKIKKLTIECLATFEKKGKIAFVGNGGSAAEAMHLAAEFTGKCVVPHDPLPAICLNESQSALTAIGNDYGFDKIFSRLVEAHLEQNDILIALSTSGKSKNIVEAIESANKIGVKTYLWSGATKTNLKLCDEFNAPSNSTPRIQEIHLIWGHILSEILELHFTKR